jgi:flagellar motor switch protein FliG
MSGTIDTKIFLSISRKDMNRILRNSDWNNYPQRIPIALKGMNPEVQEHFFSAMSKNRKTVIIDDMKNMGPVKLVEVEKEQKKLIQSAWYFVGEELEAAGYKYPNYKAQ